MKTVKATHQKGILSATTKQKPVKLPISEIASVGHPLGDYDDQEKVQRMRRQLRKGKKPPPIRVTPLTDALRDQYGITQPDKKFFLDNGHHRFAAAKLQGKKRIKAVSFHHGKRI